MICDFNVTMWIMLAYIGTCVGYWVFKQLHQDWGGLELS